MTKNRLKTLRLLVTQRWGGDRTLRHGAHSIGVGPARKGWAAYTAAGDGVFLGDDVETSIARLEDEIAFLRRKHAEAR